MEDVKASGVFLGVVDLFAVLMPGFLLVWAIRILLPGQTLEAGLPPGEGARWLALGVEAYVAGHFIFFFSSALDQPLYDRLIRPRFIAHDLSVHGDAYTLATNLKHRFFGAQPGPMDRDGPMNTFTWAKTIMALRAPRALADVQRFEADSKFFRSLTLLTPILGLVVLARGRLGPGEAIVAILATVVLTALAAWRYGERRFKSTQWAYNYVITLFGSAESQALQPPPVGGDEGA